MAENPAEDDDVEIINGTFDDNSGWTRGAAWTIAGGKAHFVGFFPGDDSMFQNPGFNEDFSYRVTFTITNMVMGGGGTPGLRCIAGGVPSAIFQVNGTYEFDFVASNDIGQLRFDAINAIPGDTIDLDDVILTKFQNYMSDELGFDTILPVFTTVNPAVQTDFYNRLNARKDNTDILIAYDVP